MCRHTASQHTRRARIGVRGHKAHDDLSRQNGARHRRSVCPFCRSRGSEKKQLSRRAVDQMRRRRHRIGWSRGSGNCLTRLHDLVWAGACRLRRLSHLGSQGTSPLGYLERE